MRQPRSIRLRFASVFLFLLLLVVLLGLVSISQLSSFNQLSADVADTWLPKIRALGDLNNFTSDFRAIEGSNLLSSDGPELAHTEKEMEELDRAIAGAERSFERIPQDEAERSLYAHFETRWSDYRKNVNQLLALSRADRKADAIALYRSGSREAYNAASVTLGKLTDQGVINAEAASSRLGVAYKRALWLLSFAMLVTGAMVAAALLYVGRSISAPLLRLSDRMHRLATSETEIDIPGTERRDEIGEMARATLIFRKNAIELIRSQQVLAKQALMLKEQLEQEQRLAQLQRSFVSMASHEFRTPLTIIDGHAQRLIKFKHATGRDDLMQRAGKIRSAVLRLTHLIDNLLGSSRLIDGASEVCLEPAELDLKILLHDVCELHQEMAPESRISERFGTMPICIVGDSKLLSQVFGNLLSNAIKYSPSGAPVEIGLEQAKQEAVVTIEDSGIGIPATDVGRLFGRHERGSNVSGIVGTGLGLYIAKVIVDLHRGLIEVESKEGKGSRFTVRLPIKPLLQASGGNEGSVSVDVETEPV